MHIYRSGVRSHGLMVSGRDCWRADGAAAWPPGACRSWSVLAGRPPGSLSRTVVRWSGGQHPDAAVPGQALADQVAQVQRRGAALEPGVVACRLPSRLIPRPAWRSTAGQRPVPVGLADMSRPLAVESETGRNRGRSGSGVVRKASTLVARRVVRNSRRVRGVATGFQTAARSALRKWFVTGRLGRAVPPVHV
jgi:hypothetical protein